MKNGTVQWRKRGGVAAITFAGDAGNRIDAAVAQGLCRAVEEIAFDPEVAVVSIASRGADFCLGGAAQRDVPDWATALASIEQPLVTLVQGDAVDEGSELTLIADIRIASRSARFRWSHLGDGRLPSAGATQRLPRIVGRARALDLLLSGRWLTAAEAERIGLVTRREPPEKLRAKGSALARRLARKAPIALRYAKEAILAGSDMTLAQGIGLEQDLYVLLQTTADRAEGVRSFIARRPAKFRGK